MDGVTDKSREVPDDSLVDEEADYNDGEPLDSYQQQDDVNIGDKRKRSLSDKQGTRTEYKRFRIVSEEDQDKWALPEGMATYANELFDKFIPDNQVR